MSDEALREQLFSLLQKSGIKNQIKAKLRSELVKLVDQKPKNSAISDLSTKQKSILTKFTDQLILTHLKSNKYEYAASVFESEAGLNREKFIKASDFFNIADNSHKELLENNDLSKLVLHLLNSKSELLSNLANKNSDNSCQTDQDLLTYSETIHLLHSRKRLKIEAIDNAALREIEQTIEKRLASTFERNLARQLFDQSENVRKEEKFKYDAKFKEISDNFDIRTSIKEQNLLERARTEKEKLNNLAELNSKDLSHQRQVLLDKTEKLATMEKTLDVLRAEMTEKERDLTSRQFEIEHYETSNRDHLKTAKQILRRECHDEANNNLNNERIAAEEMFQNRENVVNEKEKYLVRKERKLNTREDKVTIQEESNKLLENENDDLKSKLIENEETAASRAKLLGEQNEVAFIAKSVTDALGVAGNGKSNFGGVGTDTRSLRTALVSMASQTDPQTMKKFMEVGMNAGVFSREQMLEIGVDTGIFPKEARSHHIGLQAARVGQTIGTGTGSYGAHAEAGTQSGTGPAGTAAQNSNSRTEDLNETTFSVSSFVDGMKKRVAGLEFEANNLEDQYENYKSGILK